MILVPSDCGWTSVCAVVLFPTGIHARNRHSAERFPSLLTAIAVWAPGWARGERRRVSD